MVIVRRRHWLVSSDRRTPARLVHRNPPGDRRRIAVVADAEDPGVRQRGRASSARRCPGRRGCRRRMEPRKTLAATAVVPVGMPVAGAGPRDHPPRRRRRRTGTGVGGRAGLACGRAKSTAPVSPVSPTAASAGAAPGPELLEPHARPTAAAASRRAVRAGPAQEATSMARAWTPFACPVNTGPRLRGPASTIRGRNGPGECFRREGPDR